MKHTTNGNWLNQDLVHAPDMGQVGDARCEGPGQNRIRIAVHQRDVPLSDHPEKRARATDEFFG